MLWLLQMSASRREALLGGLAFGLGYFGFGVYWIYNSLHDFGMAPPIVAGGITGLLVIVLALFPALTFAFFHYTRQRLGDASLWLLPPLPTALVRPSAALRLVRFFLTGSLRGALLVARRAVARRPVIRSRIVQWHTPLQTPLARFALVNAISLMPGTLTTRINGGALDVHLFDADLPWREEATALETHIIATFEPSAGGER